MHIKYEKCKKPDDRNYTSAETKAIIGYIELMK